jgi:uncharacterized protein
MTLKEFNEILIANQIFKEFELDKIGVFGSFARNEEYNDLDLLLENYMHHSKRDLLKVKLENIFKMKVDIVPATFADPIILFRARKDLKYATSKGE